MPTFLVRNGVHIPVGHNHTRRPAAFVPPNVVQATMVAPDPLNWRDTDGAVHRFVSQPPPDKGWFEREKILDWLGIDGKKLAQLVRDNHIDAVYVRPIGLPLYRIRDVAALAAALTDVPKKAKKKR